MLSGGCWGVGSRWEVRRYLLKMIGELMSVELMSVELMSGELMSGELMSGELRSGELRRSELRRDEVKSAKLRRDWSLIQFLAFNEVGRSSIIL